jgi:acetyl-CoA C-acetyltransferase
MPEPIFIVGAARTDFARNWQKDGYTLRQAVADTALGAVADAGLPAKSIQAGFVGNFAAGLFTRQLHLGAFIADAHPDWRGLPTAHTEAACASGSVAVIAGIDRLLSGRADCVVVVGAEQQKTMPPKDVGDVMAAAGDWAVERPEWGDFPIPKMFGRVAAEYLKLTGAPTEVLAKVAVKNRENARLNPLAQMRAKTLSPEAAVGVSDGNPVVADPLKVSDCSQITDGAAAVVLATEGFLKKNPTPRRVRVLGFGQATDHLRFDAKDVPRFDVATRAARAAYDMAGLEPKDIQAAEVHDCFSITEIVATEILGLAERGCGWKSAESGATARGGTLPINVGGGLIGDGHPVGATGVRQLHECFVQLTGTAGERQIDGVRRMVAWNMGGTFTTTCTFVLGN